MLMVELSCELMVIRHRSYSFLPVCAQELSMLTSRRFERDRATVLFLCRSAFLRFIVRAMRGVVSLTHPALAALERQKGGTTKGTQFGTQIIFDGLTFSPCLFRPSSIRSLTQLPPQPSSAMVPARRRPRRG